MTDDEADDHLANIGSTLRLMFVEALKQKKPVSTSLLARHLDGVANIIEALASRFTKLTRKERAPT
jgi:hypothetical protein